MKIRYISALLQLQMIHRSFLVLLSYQTTSVKGFLFLSPHTHNNNIHTNRNQRWPIKVQSERLKHNKQITTMNGKNNNNDDLKKYISEFKLLITQRCIQSFMFLLAETRDLHTVKWLDEFIQPMIHEDDSNDDENIAARIEESRQLKFKGSILLFYHGLPDSVFNTTIFGEIEGQWDNFFWLLLEQPIEVIHVDSHYKQSVPHYDIEIHPARLCSRILSVREQICKEIYKDIDAIIPMSQHILDSYWDNVDKERSSPSSSSTSKSFDRQGLLFLEWDSVANNEGLAPSPLRQANFDLLNLLITKVAIQQILHSSDPNLFGSNTKSSSAKENSLYKDFLYAFFTKHYSKYFEGNVQWGNAENFLEELMLSSPVINEEYSIVISPLKVVEVILQRRSDIVGVWKEHVNDIAKDHFEIRKVQLTKMMEY